MRKINMDLCKIKKDGSYKLDKEACIGICGERYEVFRSETQENYARVVEGDKIKEYDIQSEDIKRDVRNFLRKESGLDFIDNPTIKGILDFLADKAFDGEEKRLASRAFYDAANECVLIDTCDGNNVICISKKGVEKKQRPLAVFQEYSTDLPLKDFVPGEAVNVPSIIQRVTRLNKEDAVILATYLVACLYGNSKPVPILFITGPMGSAKTSLSRLIQECVDPSKGGVFCLSEKLKDLAIATSKRLLCVFDNTGGLKRKKKLSDFLCTVVTKGSMQMRTLYTTKDETVLKFRSNLVINGIDFLADQTDLLNRCIMIELDTIPEAERKTEVELDAEIKKVMPELMGGLYDVIQKVLGMEELSVSKLHRMADYELLAIKAAKAMGFTVEEFQSMFDQNIQNMHDTFAMSDITIKALSMLMADRDMWEGSVSELHMACYNVLNGNVLKSEMAAFPKDASAFSQRIKSMVEQLKHIGISFVMHRTNKNMQITVSRV